MYKKIYIIFIVIFFLTNLVGSNYRYTNNDLDLKEYISELYYEYNGNVKEILEYLDDEIQDNKRSVAEIGNMLVARQQYLYVDRQYYKVQEYSKEIEKYLIANKNTEQLMFFYFLMSNISMDLEKYYESYMYMYKQKKYIENNGIISKNKLQLERVIAMEYLEATIELKLGFTEEAEHSFLNAEKLENTYNVKGSIEINYYKMLYDYFQENYMAVKNTLKDVSELEISKENYNYIYRNEYVQAYIILAISYLKTGEIDKCVEIAKKINRSIDINESKDKDDIYLLYSLIYEYYGNTGKSIEYLKKAYYEAKNINMNIKVITIVNKIIELYEVENSQKEILLWSQIYTSLINNTEIIEEHQRIIKEIINTELNNDKLISEIFQSQKSKLYYTRVISGMVIVIIVILIVVQLNNKKVLESNIKMLEEQMLMQYKYYKSIKQNQENTARIRHDIKNHLNIINQLIVQKDYDAVKKYMEQINQVIVETKPIIYTNNKIVGAILLSKIKICNENNIKIDCDVKIPEILNISDFDLCVIFGNLIDNAIEACNHIDIKNELRYIKIRSYTKGSNLFLSILNSKSKEIKIKEGNFKTTKDDKENHGLGIGNVRACVKKYNGHIKFDVTEENFSVKVLLRA